MDFKIVKGDLDDNQPSVERLNEDTPTAAAEKCYREPLDRTT